MLRDVDEMGEELVGSTLTEEVIRVVGISVRPMKVNERPLYIVLKKGGKKIDKLPPKATSEWRKWTLTAPLILEQSSELTIELLRKRRVHTDDRLAEPKVSFDRLQLFLDSVMQNHTIVEYQIHANPEMRLNLDPGTIASEMRMKRVAQRLRETPSLLERTGKWRGLLVTLLEISTAISEAHPTAKAVLAIVNVVYRKLQAQDERVEQVRDLVESMAYMCRCICEVKQSARSVLFEETIKEAGPLMIRIEKFISSWATSGTVDIFVNDSSKRELSELNKDYITFRERLDRGIAMNTNAGVELLLEENQDKNAEKLLEQLLPKGIDDILPAARCLEGTRGDILKTVDTYLDNFDEPNVLWIRGHPGVGKSTIASTIVSRLNIRRRPALHFIFERAKADITTPSALWRYVGYKLARWYPSARQCIVEQLQVEDFRLNASNSEDLFKRLVEQSLEKSLGIPPGRLPVIVIDGLDECGGLEGRWSAGRRELLKALKRWPQLPAKFKLVVTSRPEVDIASAFRFTSITSIDLFSGEAVTPQTSNDIRTFLVHRFHDIVEHHLELSEDWPGPSEIDELTTRAAGLFIWAKTAVDFVDRGEPTGRLRDITSHRHKLGVGDLYTLILKTHYSSPTPEELRDFHTLASAMMVAKRPLSDIECTHLLGISESRLATFRINLQSVLDPKDTRILRFTHQSFVDFLLDPHDCPEHFRITNPGEKRYLIDACLKTMSLNLRFNICHLRTSTLLNTDVSDIKKKVEDNVPSHLSYSCCFWADHLSSVPFDKDLVKIVKEVVERVFLYWLEVMSLLNEMDRVDSDLIMVLEWLKPANDEAFSGFVKDARWFVSAFRHPIAQSTPHIYISALPFAPQQSRIAQHFLNDYPRTITVTSGKPTHWPSSLFVTEHHRSAVNALAFSPDQRYFASCDNTICICDAENGNLILGPLRGHSDDIWDIAFSPDGCSIVSGSSDGTVMVWDMESGDEFFCLQGYEGIYRVAYSHDGQRIAFYEIGGAIEIWVVGSGREMSNLFESHDGGITAISFSIDDQCVISVSESGTVWFWYVNGGTPSCVELHSFGVGLGKATLSPDGRFVAGEPADGIIHIWEIRAGSAPINTFKGHPSHGATNLLLAYSTDGKHLVSIGSDDQMARVWDPSIGQMVFGSLSMRSVRVGTIALSTSLAKLAVGTWDGTVVMWDLDDTEVAPLPDPVAASGSQTQTERISDLWEKDEPSLPALPTTVNYIAFSPCGKKLVSASNDAIRVWDANTGKPLSKPIRKGPVANVVFSPDGKWIASLSYDASICIWDAMGQHVHSSSPSLEEGVLWEWSAFLPDSKRLVTCAHGWVCIWDIETMANPFRHAIHDSLILSLSPDGTKVIGSTGENPPQMWSTETEQLIPFHLEGLTDQDRVVFSPSGKLVCSFSFFSEVFKVWDMVTGREVAVGSLGMRGAFSLAFSPDDQFIVAAVGDRSIRVFDVVTCCLTHGPWYGHTSDIKDIVFSPDGNKLASCSEDGMIRMWDTSDFTGSSPGHSRKGPRDPFTDECPLENGWVKGANGELLFWVPPSNRSGLWRPRNTVVIGEGVTTLDLTKFEYGENWERCQRSG